MFDGHVIFFIKTKAKLYTALICRLWKKETKANEELYATEAYDLKDFYTFVGENKGKVNDTQNKRTEVKAKENKRKTKNKVSKSDETNPDFDSDKDNGISEQQANVLCWRQEQGYSESE